MAKKLTRKQKRSRNKALFRLRNRRRNLKRACYGKARTKKGRARKLRSWKCRYHKKHLPRNKRAVKKAYRVKGRKTRGRRRARRNPGSVQRTLRDGSVVTLSPVGSAAILRVFSPEGDLVDDRKLSWEAGMKALHKHKSGKRYARRATSSAWRMVAADNPRRRRSRRNPAQFPTPFASALNPRISRAEAKAMLSVLRRHKYGRR